MKRALLFRQFRPYRSRDISDCIRHYQSPTATSDCTKTSYKNADLKEYELTEKQLSTILTPALIIYLDKVYISVSLTHTHINIQRVY